MNNLNDIFFAPAANQELTYDQVLEDVQRYFAENHASTIAEAGEANAERATALLKELMVQYIVKRKYAISGLTTEQLCEQLYEDMAGYSFLKKWIYKPGIEEVNINAYNDIEVIEAGGRSIKIPDKFSSPQHAIDVVRRMLNACGMVIDDTMPSVVGFLDTNLRTHRIQPVSAEFGSSCFSSAAPAVPAVRPFRTPRPTRSQKTSPLGSASGRQFPCGPAETNVSSYWSCCCTSFDHVFHHIQ